MFFYIKKRSKYGTHNLYLDQSHVWPTEMPVLVEFSQTKTLKIFE